jgi:hypothetical protein
MVVHPAAFDNDKNATDISDRRTVEFSKEMQGDPGLGQSPDWRAGQGTTA